MKIKVKKRFLRDPIVRTNGFQDMGFIAVALNEFKYLRASTKVAYNIIKSAREVEKAISDLEATIIILCESLCKKDKEGKLIQKNNHFQFPEQYICPKCEDSSEQEICEKCNVKSPLKVSKERDEFNDKYNKLLQEEVELDIFPIQNSALYGVQNVPIAAYETLLKFGFIQEDEEQRENKIAEKTIDKK